MKAYMTVAVGVIAVAALLAQSSDAPQFNDKNELVVPSDYREWIFLSSGLGMTYGPIADSNASRSPMFDNVFVSPPAYRAFIATGKWPEKTMFVLEARSSA